jgi:hypothetical protein
MEHANSTPRQQALRLIVASPPYRAKTDRAAAVIGGNIAP